MTIKTPDSQMTAESYSYSVKINDTLLETIDIEHAIVSESKQKQGPLRVT